MTNIQVAIKVRPLIEKEIDDESTILWNVKENSIFPLDPESQKRNDYLHQFDHIFNSDKTNHDVFDIVAKPIIETAISGMNGTIFAYGQTSSGKTFTMMGGQGEPGIMTLSVDHLFNCIRKANGREFLLRVSYIEIYNEHVNDLLDDDNKDIKVREENGEVVVKCKEQVLTDPDEVFATMKRGDKMRRTGKTDMNEYSSRSHTIFRITIESRETTSDSDGAVQVSQLNFVDLAGSERANSTGAVGERFKEGTHINRSLSALGLVIKQLSDAQQGGHINFRDSKLTRILQASLGGNAMTTIICAITPASFEETQSTLSFASRAKTVKNKPKINEVMSEGVLLKRYRKQIEKLANDLQKATENKDVDKVKEMEDILEEKDRMNKILEERIERLRQSIISSTNICKEEKIKSKKRRCTWAPGLRVLPTILEKSLENSNLLSLDKSLSTPLMDFEIDLIKSKQNCDSRNSSPNFVITHEEEESVNETDSTVNSEYTRPMSREGINSPGTPKSKLREKNNDLETQLYELEEFTKLEKQLILDEHTNNLQQQVELLKNSLSKLELENKTLTETVERFSVNNRDNVDYKARFDSLGAYTEKLEKHVEAKKVEIENLKAERKNVFFNDVKLLEVEKFNPDQEKEELRGRLEISNKELVKLRALVENYKNVKSSMGSDDMNWKQSLEDMVLKLEEDKRIMTKEIKELKISVPAQSEQAEEIEETRDLEKEELRHQLESLQTQFNDLERRLAEEENTTARLEEDNSALLSQLDEFRQSKEKEEEIERQETHLKQQLESLLAQLNHSQNETAERDSKIAELEKEKAFALSQINETNEKTESLQTQLENLRKELDEQENTVFSLEETKAEKDELNQQLGSSHQKLADLQEKLTSYEETIRVLQTENSSLRINNIKGEVSIRLMEFDESNKVQEKTEDLEAINNYEVRVQQLESENRSLIERIKELTTKVRCKDGSGDSKSKIESSAISTNESYFDGMMEESSIRGSCNSTNGTSAISEGLSTSSYCESSLRTSDISQGHAASSPVSKEVANLRRAARNLEKEKAQLTKDLQRKIKEVDEVKKDFAEFKLDMQKLQQTIGELASENKDYSYKLNERRSAEVTIDELNERETKIYEEKTELECGILNVDQEVEENIEELGHTKAGSSCCNEIEMKERTSDLDELREENLLLKSSLIALQTRVDKLVENNETLSTSRVDAMDEIERSHSSSKNSLVELVTEDTKSSSCERCLHLRESAEHQHVLKNEIKRLSLKLKDQQEKFERQCSDTQFLRMSANEGLDVSTLLNGSISESLNVTLAEERLQNFHSDLDTLKKSQDLLTDLCQERCQELEKLHDVSVNEAQVSLQNSPRPRSEGSKDRIKKLSVELDVLRSDLVDIMSSHQFIKACLEKFTHEKSSMQQEISELKDANEQLVDQVKIAESRAVDLNDEVASLHLKVQELHGVEKELAAEKSSLEMELMSLRDSIEKLNSIEAALRSELEIAKKENEQMIAEQNEMQSTEKVVDSDAKEELEVLRTNIIKESLYLNPEAKNDQGKTASEFFYEFLHLLLKKEKEVIDALNKDHNRGSRKLKEEKEQYAEAEKSAKQWVKTLELENEKLQADLTIKELQCQKEAETVVELRNNLKEASHANEMFRKKIEVLENEDSILQAHIEKWTKSGVSPKKALTSAQDKLRSTMKMLGLKEQEMNKRLKAEKDLYNQKIEELMNLVETYKSKNSELRSNLERLTSNEQQWQSAVSTLKKELGLSNNKIQELNDNIDMLSETSEQLRSECLEKSKNVEEITALLKTKCDLLSEYKTAMETMKPHQETWQKSLEERMVLIERNKLEIDGLIVERDRLLGYKTALETLQPQHEILQKNLEESLLAIEKNRNEIDGLIVERDYLLDYKTAFENLQPQHEILQKNLEESLLAIETNRNEIDILKLDCDKYKTGWENLQQHAISKNEENERLQQDLELLKKKNEELDEECESLSKDFQEYENRNTLLSNQIFDLETALEKKGRDYHSELKHDLQAAQPELQTLKEEPKGSCRPKSISPALEVNLKRRQRRSSQFNLLRHLDDHAQESVNTADDCNCSELRKQIKELDIVIVTKEAKIATLELQIQSDNLPFKNKVEELKELLLTSRKRVAELQIYANKLEKDLTNESSKKCYICRKNNNSKRDQYSQTETELTMCGVSSGIVAEHVKIQRLEKEKNYLRTLCSTRTKKLKDLEKVVKSYEAQREDPDNVIALN